MKARPILLSGSVAAALITGSIDALAQSGRQPIRSQMTCQEFLRSDDAAKPEIVYWFATRSTLGASDAVIDVEATDRLVPVVVERCNGAPGSSLSRQVSAEATRLRRAQQAP
jgi:acid stress chaperone HdeA